MQRRKDGVSTGRIGLRKLKIVRAISLAVKPPYHLMRGCDEKLQKSSPSSSRTSSSTPCRSTFSRRRKRVSEKFSSTFKNNRPSTPVNLHLPHSIGYSLTREANLFPLPTPFIPYALNNANDTGFHLEGLPPHPNPLSDWSSPPNRRPPPNSTPNQTSSMPTDSPKSVAV